MPAAIYILFGASLTFAAALSTGALVFRGLGLRFSWPVVFVVGACPLSLAVTLLALAGLAYKGVFLVLGLILIAAAAYSRSYRVLERVAIPEKWFWVGFAPFTLIYFFNAMAPEWSPDGLAYHLALVNRYYHEHRMVPVPENFYASLSQGIEMLFLYAFAWGRHSSAALVHFAYLIAGPLMIADFAARKGWPVAGAFAGLMFYATPIVGKDGTCAYNDVAIACIWFALFVLLDRFEPSLAIPVGMLAGFSYGVKYTAFVAMFYALWRMRKHPRSAVIACAVAACFVLPWVARNWLWIGNPVAPFFNAWFPNPWVTPAFEKEYTQGLRDYGLTGFGDWAANAFFKGEIINGLLGPVWLLAPLGFLEWPWILAGAAAVLNHDIRFLIPALPFLALGIGKFLQRWRRAAIDVIAAHLFLSLPWVVGSYSGNAWRLTEVPWKAALRIESEDSYLGRRSIDYVLARTVETFVPPGETVFSLDTLGAAYTNRRVLVSYYSTLGHRIRDVLFAPIDSRYSPAWRRDVRLQRPARKIRLVQESDNKYERWGISEIEPRPVSVRSSTDNWLSSYAMDRNPYTRWYSGIALTPGQWFEIEYDRPVNALVLSSARDQAALSLKVDGQDASITLRDDPMEPVAARRWATETVRGFGVRYLVIGESDFGYIGKSDVGYRDFVERAAEWNLTLIAERGPKKLFKIN